MSQSVQPAMLVIQTGWLVNNEHLFLLVLEAWKSPITALADSVSGESGLPAS